MGYHCTKTFRQEPSASSLFLVPLFWRLRRILRSHVEPPVECPSLQEPSSASYTVEPQRLRICHGSMYRLQATVSNWLLQTYLPLTETDCP